MQCYIKLIKLNYKHKKLIMYYVRFKDKLNNGEKVWIIILVMVMLIVMVTIIKILEIVGNKNLVL